MQLREVTERYQLDKILRSNRSGTVLRAIDSQSGQAVAVKLITVGTSPGLAGVPRFEALAAALAAPHPNLPEVLDSGFTPDGSAFLVLPFLEGRNFETLAGGPPANVLPLLMQALDGLEALARRGVAHHNLTPDNLLVVASSSGPRVKLLGLGSAIFQAPDLGANAQYRAPELGTAGGGTADWRADLYSFALTACRALGATESLSEGDPVVQMPFALSFELENAEGIRQALERCLRRQPEVRPSHAEIREAFRPALASSEPAWREKTNPVLVPAVPAPAPPLVATPPREPLPPAPPPRPVASPPPAAPPIPPAPSIAPAPAAPAAASTPDPLREAPFPAAVIPAAPPAAPAPSVPPPAPIASAPSVPVTPSPAASEPDPDGELFPSITDDILNALPDDWQPSPGAAPATPTAARLLPFGKGKPATAPTAASAEATPGAVAASAAPKPSPLAGLLRRPLVLGAIGAAVLLIVLAVLFLGTEKTVQTAPAAPVAASVPPPPPPKPPGERLREAEELFAQNKDFRARQVLQSITAEDQATLPPDVLQRLNTLRQTITLSAGERLPADLEAGFGNGEIDRLRNAVAAAPDVDLAALPAKNLEDLEKARKAVGLYEQAEAAAERKENIAVLERFGELSSLLPRMKDSQDLREKAAAVLEADAQKLAEAGQYSEAAARLEPLQRTWSDRDGLRERISSFEKYQQAEPGQKAILEKLPSMERRRKPYDALEVVNAVDPIPHLAPQFAAARKRLEDQLVQLDKAPPQIVLRDGFYLEYARGTVANLSFRVTDDYQVKSVKLMARPEGGKMREVPLKKSTFAYSAEITPSFHKNGTVDFYVVATDLSGHEATLGSRDKPMQVKRTQGFEGFVR